MCRIRHKVKMREIYGAHRYVQTSKCVEAVEGEWEIGYFLQHLVATPARKIGFNSYLLTTHEIFVYTFVYIYSLSSVCQLSVHRLSIYNASQRIQRKMFKY